MIFTFPYPNVHPGHLAVITLPSLPRATRYPFINNKRNPPPLAAYLQVLQRLFEKVLGMFISHTSADTLLQITYAQRNQNG